MITTHGLDRRAINTHTSSLLHNFTSGKTGLFIIFIFISLSSIYLCFSQFYFLFLSSLISLSIFITIALPKFSVSSFYIFFTFSIPLFLSLCASILLVPYFSFSPSISFFLSHPLSLFFIYSPNRTLFFLWIFQVCVIIHYFFFRLSDLSFSPFKPFSNF